MTTKTSPIRIVLVDDHARFREGMKHVLSLDPMFTVVGEAGCALEGEALADLLKPHLMLVDIRLPDLSGIQLTRRIVAKHLGIRVVMLSMFTSEEYVLESFRAGAVGYLVKHANVSDLFDNLRNVLSGDWVVDRSLVAFAHFRNTGGRSGPCGASNKQTTDDREPDGSSSHRGTVEGRSNMNGYMEKRKQDRWPYELSIVYSKFHSGIDHATRSCNISDTGLCLNVDSPIPRGTPVFVRVENGNISNMMMGDDLCPRTVGLAEVRWCRKVENGGELSYQVGVKYLHPAY